MKLMYLCVSVCCICHYRGERMELGLSWHDTTDDAVAAMPLFDVNVVI